MAVTNLGMTRDLRSDGGGMAQWQMGGANQGGTSVPSWNEQATPWSGSQNPYANLPGVQPSNPNQSQEAASMQANINKMGMTEAQARQQYGDAGVNNAMAKGITFGGAGQSGGQTGQLNLNLPNGFNNDTSYLNKIGAYGNQGGQAPQQNLGMGSQFQQGNNYGLPDYMTIAPAQQYQMQSYSGNAGGSAPSGGNQYKPASGGNSSMSQFNMQTGGPNPYLSQQANAITQNVTDNLKNNVLPGISSGAVAAGGFGGSRQGIAEGLAMQGANRDIANAQANLYGQGYTADQANKTQLNISGMNNSTTQRGQDMNQQLGYAGLNNQYNIANMQNQLGYAGLNNQMNIAGMQNATAQRGQDQNYNLGLGNLNNQINIAGMNNATTQRGQDQNYNLGLGNLNLQNNKLDADIYNSNFNNQLASANFGLNAYDKGMQYNQQAIQNATNQYQLPLQWQQFFNNAYNSAGGQGGTSTTTTGSTSNPLMQLATLFGYGGNSSTGAK